MKSLSEFISFFVYNQKDFKLYKLNANTKRNDYIYIYIFNENNMCIFNVFNVIIDIFVNTYSKFIYGFVYVLLNVFSGHLYRFYCMNFIPQKTVDLIHAHTRA